MDERSLTEIYHGLQDAKTEPIETGLGIVSDDAWSVKVKSQHLSTEVVESLFSKGADIYRQATLIAIPALRLGALYCRLRRQLLRVMMAVRLQRAARSWLRRRKEQVERLLSHWIAHDVLRTVRSKRRGFDVNARVPIWNLLGRQITTHSKLRIIGLLLKDYRRQFHETWGAWEARCRAAGYGPRTRARLMARQKVILQGVNFLGAELFPGGIHMAKEVDVGAHFMQLMLEQPVYAIDPADLFSVPITSRNAWRHVLALDVHHPAASPAAAAPSPLPVDRDAAAAIEEFEGKQRDLRLAKLVEEYRQEAARHLEQDKQRGVPEMEAAPKPQLPPLRRGTAGRRSVFVPVAAHPCTAAHRTPTKPPRALRLPSLVKRPPPPNKVILVVNGPHKPHLQAPNRSAGVHLAPLLKPQSNRC
eukprot:EG_transcript_13058